MCRLAPPPFVCAVAWSAYEGEVRQMLHLLKFEGVRSVAGPLAKFLAGAIAQIEPGAPREMTVIAVPMHSGRLRQRGYNHSRLLAEGAVRILRKQYPTWRLTEGHDLLSRQRATEILFPLTPASRRKMLQGAFRCAGKEGIKGKAVLLIDDIMTTGTTARECSKTLLRAGAKSVHVATLARAQRETIARWNANELKQHVN